MSRTTIGKYINLERIGAGGMAEVFIGDDPSLDRKVAIKLILPHLATAGDFEERFRREAKTVAALRHNNIIQIYEYAIEDGNPYMVMEYLEKGSLEEYLTLLRSRDEIMPIDQAVEFLDKIASGLDYAHKRDLIHRDIKPSNILLSADDEPIIADFGIVKMLNESVVLTQTGGVVGSPRYLPPEQASNAPVDHRSDIYSLGIMLYEMVTGEVPFDGDLISIMMQHVNEIPQSPTELNPDLSWSASSVILQALAKDPADRFQSAGEMAIAFKKALAIGAAAAAAPTPTPVEEKSVTIEGGVTAAPKPTLVSNASATIVEKPRPASTKTGMGGLPKPVIYGGGALAILALIFGAYSIFGGGNGDTNIADSNSTAPTVEATQEIMDNAADDTSTIDTDLATEEPTIAPTATTVPTPTPFPEPWVEIADIRIENGVYVVDYETYGYTEALPGDHIHFFFNNVLLENAGEPGNGPWIIYGGPSPFTQYAVSSRPLDAIQMCALFANPDHTVENNTGNCFNLSGKSTSEGFVLEGEWNFSMYAVGSNSAYDRGSITFTDDDTGTYNLIDFYEFDNPGEFIITEDGFEMQPKNWIGHFEDANTISGTWDNGDATGSFIATRK